MNPEKDKDRNPPSLIFANPSSPSAAVVTSSSSSTTNTRFINHDITIHKYLQQCYYIGMAGLKTYDTKHVSLLAKLDLTPKEIDKFTPQLAAVVDLIDKLSEVDIKDTKATVQTTKLVNVLRKDEIDVTRILPQNESFTVPQILNKRYE